jgi:hypothetical protein
MMADYRKVLSYEKVGCLFDRTRPCCPSDVCTL